jgi:predicted DNA-binding protein YlxM (UPF0122 family)
MTVIAKVKQTLATLKNIESTLGIYASQTDNAETKSVFKESIQYTKEVIADIEQRIKKLEFEEPQYKGY